MKKMFRIYDSHDDIEASSRFTLKNNYPELTSIKQKSVSYNSKQKNVYPISEISLRTTFFTIFCFKTLCKMGVRH